MTGPPCPAELRTDVLTGRQVILAPGRSERPGAVTADPPVAAGFGEGDPFAEGHEQQTPDESLALRSVGSEVNQPGWLLRVTANLYPAVSAQRDWAVPAKDATPQRAVIAGVHEVVIECPDDRSRLTELTSEEILRILYAWQLRVRDLNSQPGTEFVSVFRNQGFSAGASLAHCHSQILAMNHVPPTVGERVRRANEHRRTHGTDLVEDVLHAERGVKSGILNESGNLIAYCPFASRVAWHVRWLPTQTSAFCFESLTHDRLAELASSLLAVARAVESLTGTPSANLVLVLPPAASPDSFRWMLDLLPRTSRIAGFELLADVDILTAPPEFAATQLRERIEPLPPADVRLSLFPAGFHWQAARMPFRKHV